MTGGPRAGSPFGLSPCAGRAPLTLGTHPAFHYLFDLAAWAAAALLARFLYRWRLRGAADRAVSRLGPGYAVSLAIGAVAGAWGFGSANSAMMPLPHLSHSLAGALAGGIIGVELYKASRGIRLSTGSVWVGPLALGIAIGRLGCLFAGIGDSTYGVPTNLPWGVDLGDGIPRHPVQLYESLSMLLFLGLYLRALARRSAWAMERAFYPFILFYAGQRFAWEFLKPYPDLAGPLNLFQLLAGGMAIYALVFDARSRRAA